MNKFLLLLVMTIAFVSCDNSNSSNEPENKTLLLEKKKIECSFDNYSDRIFVKTNIDFDLEIKDYCSWIDYKAGEDSVFIDIDKNWSTDVRSCNLIIVNDQYNLADTLFILQDGYESNGDSSENGGSGSNNGANNGSSGGDINNGGSSVSRQCAAYTKKGKRCKRTASKGSIYCWQHK